MQARKEEQQNKINALMKVMIANRFKHNMEEWEKNQTTIGAFESVFTKKKQILDDQNTLDEKELAEKLVKYNNDVE